MPNSFFFLNYGGPGGASFTADETEKKELIKACVNKSIGLLNNSFSLTIKGIHVTLYTFCVHKALSLDLPDDASEDTRNFFAHIKKVAVDFCETDYHLASHNCVTAVATILNQLDSELCPPDLISPFSLDTHFKRYARYADINDPTLKTFLLAYQKMIDNDYSFFSSPCWQAHEVRSLNDLIIKAHSPFLGQRTITTFFKLGWIVGRNQHHQFLIGKTAPEAFRQALETYYKVQVDKKLQMNALTAAYGGIYVREF